MNRELQELIFTLLRSCPNGKKTENNKTHYYNRSQITIFENNHPGL